MVVARGRCVWGDVGLPLLQNGNKRSNEAKVSGGSQVCMLIKYANVNQICMLIMIMQVWLIKYANVNQLCIPIRYTGIVYGMLI